MIPERNNALKLKSIGEMHYRLLEIKLLNSKFDWNHDGGEITMIDKSVIKELDRVIKDIWMTEIQNDYNNGYILKEDSLKCNLYYHMRNRLESLLSANNLRIFTEFYFPNLKYYADIAIVEIDPTLECLHLKEMVVDVAVIIELKFTGGYAVETEKSIKNDVQKVKSYIQNGELLCQFYLGIIYETECVWLNWLDKRSTNHWANGHVTELNAGYIDGLLEFEVNSYNRLNV